MRDGAVARRPAPEPLRSGRAGPIPACEPVRPAALHSLGQRVRRFGDRIDADDLEILEGERCASAGGVSLHANVAVPARDRRRLERLCRYVARPPVATERLSRRADGTLLYRLKHRWRDGTTHVVFTPQELLEKLAALVPPPRFYMARYHGILGPCASERDRVVPGASCVQEPTRPTQGNAALDTFSQRPINTEVRGHGNESDESADRSDRLRYQGTETASAPSHPEKLLPAPDRTALRRRRLDWADLLRRVFAIDVLECPRCGGRMRLIAAIHPPEATRAILDCLALPSRAPPAASPVALAIGRRQPSRMTILSAQR